MGKEVRSSRVMSWQATAQTTAARWMETNLAQQPVPAVSQWCPASLRFPGSAVLRPFCVRSSSRRRSSKPKLNHVDLDSIYGFHCQIGGLAKVMVEPPAGGGGGEAAVIGSWVEPEPAAAKDPDAAPKVQPFSVAKVSVAESAARCFAVAGRGVSALLGYAVDAARPLSHDGYPSVVTPAPTAGRSTSPAASGQARVS